MPTKTGWTQVVHCVGSTQCREQGSSKTGWEFTVSFTFLPCEVTILFCVSAQDKQTI